MVFRVKKYYKKYVKYVVNSSSKIRIYNVWIDVVNSYFLNIEHIELEL